MRINGDDDDMKSFDYKLQRNRMNDDLLNQVSSKK